MTNGDINVLVLTKGAEHYVLQYRDETKVEAVKTLARWAQDKELSFTWYDVAVLSQAIRNGNKKAKAPLREKQHANRF